MKRFTWRKLYITNPHKIRRKIMKQYLINFKIEIERINNENEKSNNRRVRKYGKH